MPDDNTTNPAERTERIGKYEILGHIATGGMGVVYKARDVELNRLVALKILPPEMAKQSNILERFRREAKAAAQLRHDNIVTIFDFDEFNGTWFIALEFVDGHDLQFYISRKCRLDPEETRQILIQAARALMHAHEHKVVHRDIKPSNLLLVRKEKKLIVKLTDFGLAIQHENDADFRITRDKTTVGTIDYMAPEQARDSRLVDIRSDIYSLGCTAYHMLAGMAPFARGTLPERIVKHLKLPPPDLRKLNKSVPSFLIAIINRMLAKKPRDRYQTPAELLQDLEHPEKMELAESNTAKTGRPGKDNSPTTVLANDEIEEAPAEPPQVKTQTSRKTPATARTEHADDWFESASREGTGRKVGRSKKAKSSPLLMYAAFGGIGMLALVLVVVLATYNPHPPKKDPEKPSDPPPIAKVEWKPEPKPPIDTDPAKMTVRTPALPIMDTAPEKADAAALRNEYRGEFASFPRAPTKATVLRVSRLPDAGPYWFRTIAEALVRAQAEESSVIEIQDNGPLFVSSLPALSKRSVTIRGGEGYRPLLIWNTPKNGVDAKTPLVFASLTEGALIFDNIDFILNASASAPAFVFDVPETDLFIRNCTFSLAGNGAPITLARRADTASKNKTQTWLSRTYVRGPEAALLELKKSSSSVLIEESLFAGQNQPVLQIRGDDDTAVDLRCVRSTIVAAQTFLRWQSIDGVRCMPAIRTWMLDSIVSRDDAGAVKGDMIELANNGDAARMRWRANNCVYSGWKHLLASRDKTIVGRDLDGWHRQWVYSDGDRAFAEPWPSQPPTALEDQSADAFLPADTPLHFAALSGPGAIGSVVGWLPTAPVNWRDRLFTQRSFTSIPGATSDLPGIEATDDGLYHGERLDLNKVDLGAYLNSMFKQKLPGPRVVLHVSGKGTCFSSPLRIKGVQQLILCAVPKDPRDPLLLEISAPTLTYNSPAIEMTGGNLELIGLRVRVNPNSQMPSMIYLGEGDLTLTRCTLFGPLFKPSEAFQSLITMNHMNGAPATLLLRDNVLLSGKTLAHVQNHVQIRARNNLGVALGNALVIDANRPMQECAHVLDHNTFAARHSTFVFRTGADFEAAGQVWIHAASNAFLSPFAEAVEQRALLRSSEGWLRSGRLHWQGRFNVYDNRQHAYLAVAAKPVIGKQQLRDWQSTWGPIAEFEAQSFDAGPLVKAITTETPTIANLATMLDRFNLPRTFRSDPDQPPPGADLWDLGVLKKKN